MQSFIILALVAVAAADVSHLNLSNQGQEAAAVVLKQGADVFPDKYQYGYETSNNIAAEESGVLQNAGQENAAIAAQGQYSYTAPDGQKISLTYVADANGFQPQGAHLPTTPAPQEIPEYIIRSLEYIRTHPAKEEKPYYRA